LPDTASGGVPAADTFISAGYSGKGQSDDLLTDGPSFNYLPPTFSTSGGTTADNELTWTDQGAASNAATWSSITFISGAGVVPAGNFILLP
jgi:hypothetical protein